MAEGELFAVVAERGGVWAENLNGCGDAVCGAEESGIDGDHQGDLAGGKGCAGAEGVADAGGEGPAVDGVVERNGRAGDVFDFDELVGAVEGVVHHFVDDDRADDGSGVGGAGCGRGQSGEIAAAGALDIAAETYFGIGDAV